MRRAIILFGKAPVVGRVKTRLVPFLSAEQASELHNCLVRDAIKMLRSLPADIDVQLHTDAPTDAWSDLRVATFCQSDGDLGDRMLHALATALADGRPRAVIAGSDMSGLPPGHLLGLLDATSDVALGPTEDGGYYAISCRKVHRDMFKGVRWSEPHALADTRLAAENCGLTVELGASWYDLDTPADLLRLMREPVHSSNVRRFFRTLVDVHVE